MIKSLAAVGFIFIAAYLITRHFNIPLPAVPMYQGVNIGPISSTKIDHILCEAGSPACGTGSTFYQGGLDYGVDPAMALAFFHHESSYGLAGVARETHGIGNIICTPGYACIGRFRAYTSWKDGIIDWYRLIAGREYRGRGLLTVEEIVPVYAPASENNVAGYIESVNADMERYRQ